MIETKGYLTLDGQMFKSPLAAQRHEANVKFLAWCKEHGGLDGEIFGKRILELWFVEAK